MNEVAVLQALEPSGQSQLGWGARVVHYVPHPADSAPQISFLSIFEMEKVTIFSEHCPGLVLFYLLR